MLKPFQWQDKPALIEHLFPVQKISAESFKEQEARQSKTLTPLGSYWKGRKPLILNKACILGSLLPATDNPLKDLQIFELLMGMDIQSMEKRIAASLPASKQDNVGEYLVLPYYEQVEKAKRPEELSDTLFSHIWNKVNAHLGTSASSFPELTDQIGIARFGHRPRVADVFCGSGQIPFEAARLGCDVYASDLNPIACMLTWGGINIVGGNLKSSLLQEQSSNIASVQAEVGLLGVETDGNGWYTKAFLYCVEIKCPETGWLVPLLPQLVSKGHSVIAKLVPDYKNKRYDIVLEYKEELTEEDEKGGSIRSNGKGQDSYVYHIVDGIEHRIKISSIRQENIGGTNNLRMCGRGRPCTLTKEQKTIVLRHIEKSPRSLNKVIADLEQEFDIPLSIDIIKSVCKTAGLVWKRVRKSLRSKRDQIKVDAATDEIKELIQQHKNGCIDLTYFDQSGFTLEPCVPYAWQPINETIEVSSSKSKRLNVLGFVNRDCKFNSFVFEGTTTSAVVIACFDWFSDQIEKPTSIIIDKTSIHTSDEFNSNIEDWEEKGLKIYRLPTYSPELNIIEILWRKIKYDGLPFDAYKSFAHLKRELFDVLANIGISYKIAFS